MNSEKQIAVYDNSVTAREYIGHIAESAGCFAFIGRDGKLYFRNIYQDEVEMSIDLFSEYKWGEEFKISKVSYEDGVRSFKFGDDTGNNLWINQDNVFVVDEEQIENIYNNIKGLTINSFEGSSVIDPAIDIGDKIIINGKPIVYQGEMILQGKFVAQFDSKIQIKQKEETTVKKESQKSIYRKVKSEINQLDGRITQEVSEIETKLGENCISNGDFENDLTDWSISTASQTSGSVTIKEENDTKYAQILSKADSTKLIQKIRGLKKDIEYTLMFNAYDNGDLDIDLENGIFQVDIKQYREEGSEEVIEQITERIYITKENESYTVQFTPGEDVDIELIFTLDNPFVSDYTMSVMLSNVSLCSGKIAEQLAKLEMKSNKMNLEVGKKVNNEDFTGANIILQINDDDSSEVQINADKFNINGTVSANGNFKVDTKGNVTMNEATITGGKMSLKDEGNEAASFDIKSSNGAYEAYYMSNGANFYGDSGYVMIDTGVIGPSASILVGDNSDGNTNHTIIENGSISCTGNIYAANISSDKRLKENIADSDINAIEIVKKMGIKSFDWKNSKKHINAGYIAQEMEKIDENFVLKKPVLDKDGQVIDYKYYMNELPIMATLTKAFQEQQATIESLQKQVKELKEGKQ